MTNFCKFLKQKNLCYDLSVNDWERGLLEVRRNAQERIGPPRWAKGVWLLIYQAEEDFFAARHTSALRKLKNLLRKAEERWQVKYAYNQISLVLTYLGRPLEARLYAQRCLQMDPHDRLAQHRLVASLVLAEDFAEARKAAEEFSENPMVGLYYGAYIDCVEGRGEVAEEKLAEFLGLVKGDPMMEAFVKELLATARRVKGDAQGSARAAAESTETFLRLKHPYAAYPLILWWEAAIFGKASSPNRGTIEAARELAGKAGREGKVLAKALDSLEQWEAGEIERAALESARALEGLAALHRPLDALLWAVRTAYLGFSAKSSAFFAGLEYLRPRAPLYPMLAEDALYGKFAREVILPLSSVSQKKEGKRVRLLGPPEPGGLRDPRLWRSKKALALLKYLLLNQGTYLPAPYLAYLLWPKKPEQKALARLRTEISLVRRALGPLGELVRCSGGAYGIADDPRLWCDVAEFKRLSKRAKLRAGKNALQDLKTLLSLYSGHLLPEDRYDPYIDEERRHLHSLYREALTKAVALLLEEGKVEEALLLTSREHQKFPEDEVVVRERVRCLLAGGRPGEARELFSSFKRALWRKHRLKPGFSLEDLLP